MQAAKNRSEREFLDDAVSENRNGLVNDTAWFNKGERTGKHPWRRSIEEVQNPNGTTTMTA
jgi:hypothetical protein